MLSCWWLEKFLQNSSDGEIVYRLSMLELFAVSSFHLGLKCVLLFPPLLVGLVWQHCCRLEKAKEACPVYCVRLIGFIGV